MGNHPLIEVTTLGDLSSNPITSGSRDSGPTNLRIEIKIVLFLCIILNCLLWLMPNTLSVTFTLVSSLLWKNRSDRNKIITMLIFIVTIALYGFINIETSIELNYRFKDLAGLE